VLMLIDASLFAFMISSITSLVRYGMASYPGRHGIVPRPARYRIPPGHGMESHPIPLGLVVQQCSH
jgi:hypothetical protein